MLPQSGAGPSGAGRAPYFGIGKVLGKNGCPPSSRNEVRLMVFARNALASGPGNA